MDENELLTKHIHPMEIRMKGVEKDVEHLDRSVDKLTTSIGELKDDVQEGIGLAKKTYWILVGGASTFGVIWAGLKFMLPLIAVPVE